MGLVTGTPLGNIDSQDDLAIEGAPYIYVQDATATPLSNPDADGFYWGLSGTVAYPVYALGCYQDVAFAEDVTMNAVRCDKLGDRASIQKRNYVELTLTLTHLFPLATLSVLGNLSTPTVSAPNEKVGIGSINNTKFYMVYMPKVYDEDNADYVMIHLHRAQFVDAWSIKMTSGEPWSMTGVRIRGYADDNKPTTQKFGTILRHDISLIV